MIHIKVEVDTHGLGISVDTVKEYYIANIGSPADPVAPDERKYSCRPSGALPTEWFEVRHRRSEGIEVLVKKMFAGLKVGK